jgi:hypothetical protein
MLEIRVYGTSQNSNACSLNGSQFVCDQPFDEVEKEEFIKLMTYARHPASSVNLPSREGIRRRVMKMGEDTIDGICEMFTIGDMHILFSILIIV